MSDSFPLALRQGGQLENRAREAAMRFSFGSRMAPNNQRVEYSSASSVATKQYLESPRFGDSNYWLQPFEGEISVPKMRSATSEPVSGKLFWMVIGSSFTLFLAIGGGGAAWLRSDLVETRTDIKNVTASVAETRETLHSSINETRIDLTKSLDNIAGKLDTLNATTDIRLKAVETAIVTNTAKNSR